MTKLQNFGESQIEEVSLKVRYANLCATAATPHNTSLQLLKFINLQRHYF